MYDIVRGFRRCMNPLGAFGNDMRALVDMHCAHERGRQVNHDTRMQSYARPMQVPRSV